VGVAFFHLKIALSLYDFQKVAFFREPEWFQNFIQSRIICSFSKLFLQEENFFNNLFSLEKKSVLESKSIITFLEKIFFFWLLRFQVFSLKIKYDMMNLIFFFLL